MHRRAWILLLVLSAFWGSSYLFIKVALEDLSPELIVFLRVVLGAAVLVPVALYRRAFGALGGHLGAVVVLALAQVVAPFLLITFGEVHISSALTGILVSGAPIFTALLAPFVDHSERSQGWSAVGVGVGILGVAVLLGLDVGGGAALVGALMVLFATLGYAVGGFMIKHRFADAQPIGVATATLVVSSVMLAPLLLVGGVPAAMPGLATGASVVLLGVVGTGLAFLMFYTLIVDIGPARASLVTYIAPGFAVVYGVVLLGERVTPATIGGLALILAGSWLAAGGRIRRSRAEATPRPQAFTAS